MKLAHTVNCALLTHHSCLGKLIRNMMPGLGWAGLLLFISSCIVHGNECLISPSLLALELVPPTLAGLCVLIRGHGRSRRWEAEIQPGRWVLIWILG